MQTDNLKNLISKISCNSAKFEKIARKIEVLKLSSINGLTSTTKAMFVSYITDKLNRPVLFLSSNISKALSMKEKIETISNSKIDYLEQQESSPYQLIYSDIKILSAELSTLNNFKSNNTDILVATAKSLLNAYPSKSYYEKYSVNIAKKDSIDLYSLAKTLVELGYRRVTMVTDPGEFSLRGDILDFYPMSDSPVRIEFWGDEVEDIRYFDTESQRTTGHTSKITIQPRYKLVLTEENMSKLKHSLDEQFAKQTGSINEENFETLQVQFENILTELETNKYFEGVEYYAPYLNKEFDSIFDFLPNNTLIIMDESPEIFSNIELQHKKYLDEYSRQIEEGFALPINNLLHIDQSSIINNLRKFSNIKLDSFVEDENSAESSVQCEAMPRFSSDPLEIASYCANLRSMGQSVLVLSEYPKRIAEILKDIECPHQLINKTDNAEKLLNSKDVLVIKSSLTEGFICNDLNLALITDTELFNKKIKKATIAKRTSNKENIDFIDSIKELKVNDYVVHLSHGIGKYTGLSKQVIDGQEKDYLTIEYSKGDKLHMPAEQINMLSRYRGSGDAAPKLSKMGGADWAGTKKKVKKAIEDIAKDLLNLYAKRSKEVGHKFDPDSPWQLEMEDAFPFTETPDQMCAITASKDDMESEKPMDRLICGDVGFGKTEVAIRAIFKAVLSGKQVALLVPTTILAQQHYITITERFKPYPVKIELLSRFRKPKEQKETVKNLIKGECDIVIGTHRLLQKDIEFKDIGLLVVDEEHRFGVSHKEKLKQLRSRIDVMTLSATPIPRTLHMALSGVRDMSLINTPPVNRAPVKTYVGPYNESYVKTAINHELEREGQVYFLYNRVQTIYKFAAELQELLPNARIGIAHGQMKEKELEQAMYDFSVHNYDVLLCTTIIESGLDIPNANTMIVYDADRFGLAQLYQIRGRVGRSERQAYAYCFYKKDKELTEDAQNRLKAIKDFTTLGSGYQIAMRDLEIRGVGNILGAQQHGHMLSVGFDMYCNLLDETIKEYQGEKVNKKDPPIIDINITAFIPDDWVGGKTQKMIEYKRLADVQSIKELDIIQEEWKDRFGKIPDTVAPLIKIIRLRLLAANIGINLVRETPDNIRIYTEYNHNEWAKIKNTLPKDIVRKLKWTKAPSSSELGSSVLLLNHFSLGADELLDILENLFYYISELQKSIC